MFYTVQYMKQWRFKCSLVQVLQDPKEWLNYTMAQTGNQCGSLSSLYTKPQPIFSCSEQGLSIQFNWYLTYKKIMSNQR